MAGGSPKTFSEDRNQILGGISTYYSVRGGLLSFDFSLGCFLLSFLHKKQQRASDQHSCMMIFRIIRYQYAAVTQIKCGWSHSSHNEELRNPWLPSGKSQTDSRKSFRSTTNGIWSVGK